MSLQEQRLVLLCISKMKTTEMSKTVQISTSELSENFPDISKKDASRILRMAVNALWNRSIILRGETKKSEFRWIQCRAEYSDGRAEITFSDAIIPYISQLKEQFTRLRISDISSFSGIHAIRIYELLQQFKSTGERIMQIDDFRSALMLDKKYKEYKHLKQLLLKPALSEINSKSNLQVSMTEIKTGKRVTSLKFSFTQKNKES